MNRQFYFHDGYDSTQPVTLAGKSYEQRVMFIQQWLVENIAGITGIAPCEIDITEPFANYGLESIDVVGLSGDLQDWLQRELSPTLLYDYPTIQSLAHSLAIDTTDITNVQQEKESSTQEQYGVEPIAITGIGCRFPGAKNPEEFWQLLRDGVDAIREVPKERWDISRFYDEDVLLPGKMNTRWGGFLDGIDEFDAEFFGISPREAARMDPQQRLLLEVTWEALEDAGLRPSSLAGSRTGVFIGIANSDYSRIQFRDPELGDAYAGTGSAYSIAANRISYFLNCQGPSMAIDTACSSSLVAVHLACQSIWRGEATLALAGGVNVILSPEVTVNFTKSGFMAPDGRCKAFDAQANGYVRGEGAGIVVLKPLREALEAGDSIYAVIRGSAVNQDGRTNGLTAPNRQAQEAVLRQAYTIARVSPGSVQYIEAHGTGTALGDPIEAMALGNVLAVDRFPEETCALGSVKTNIGHLEAAAGIAGLIKVALSLKHRMIPASLHFTEPNPYIPFAELPLHVQTELTSWPTHSNSGNQLLAGVSSFGFGGTNAHIILEGIAQAQSRDARSEKHSSRYPHLLPLSAHNPVALRKLAQAYWDVFAGQETGNTATLTDICYTASVRRDHHHARLALLAGTKDEYAQNLDMFLRGEDVPGVYAGRKEQGNKPQLVFVFPGQGAQWIGMGRQLLECEPVFIEAIRKCEVALRAYVDWSLLSVLTTEEGAALLERIDVIQPTLFAIQVALAALWRSWGIIPDAVVGHSMGEVAAAYVAGALSLEDASRIICLRSQLLRKVSGQGAMAVVELSLEQAEQAIADYADRLSVAVSNSPRSTVLSGEPAALEAVLNRLEQRDIFCRRVKVDVASHSPQMDVLRDELLSILSDIQPRPAAIPLFSTVTGSPCLGTELDADYWVRNLRAPVRFASIIQRLAEEGCTLYLELSPHPILLPAIQEGLQFRQCEGLTLPSLRRTENEQEILLQSLAALYAHGYDVDWQKFYVDGGTCVPLPTYPWQRERYWLEPAQEKRRAGNCFLTHPLLGQHIASSTQAGVHYWDYTLKVSELAYLKDHRVQGRIVMPAAAYLEMAVAAAREVFGTGRHVVEGMTFQQMLILNKEDRSTIQVALRDTLTGKAVFQVSSRPAELENEPWTLHAYGTIRRENVFTNPSSEEQVEAHIPIQALSTLIEMRTHNAEVLPGTAFYTNLREHGLDYGASFQAIEEISCYDVEVIARLRMPEQVNKEAHNYLIHPALLDACFQATGAAITQAQDTSQPFDQDRALFLPVGLDSLQIYSYPIEGMETLWCHLEVQQEENGAAVPEKQGAQGSWTANLELSDEQGKVLVEARGLRVQKVMAGDAQREMLHKWLYTLAWQPQPREIHTEQEAAELDTSQTEERVPITKMGSWLVFSEQGKAGRQLQTRIQERGGSCIIVFPGESYERVNAEQYRLNPANPQDMLRLLEEVYENGAFSCAGIVHLWSLETVPVADTTLDTLQEAQQLGCHSILYLVQALSLVGWRTLPRLWLVTQGTQAVEPGITGISVAQSPVWGLGRTIMHEHPHLQCTLVDLGQPDNLAEEIEALTAELWEQGTENQLALRGKRRYIARLDHSILLDRSVKEEKRTQAKGRPFRLEMETPGILEGLTPRIISRRAPEAGEVEIEVKAAGLNFLDVLKALGIAPLQETGPLLLGSECAGIITAVGTGVKGLAIGNEVVALANGCFATHVTTPADCVVKKPAHLCFEEAASLPIAFMTAHYALHSLARIAPCERVLIHSASGGTGLAAVQIALREGAEVFATAGTDEKREFLRSLGIQHVMDSRSLSFVQDVLDATDGQGVDVVINSLTGAAMTESMTLLRPYGRFIELGKKDIYQNSLLELAPFRKNLTYAALDLAGMVRERPEKAGALLQKIIDEVEKGLLTPLPVQVFPIGVVGEAFHLMAQARHTGKLVISLQDRTETLISTSSSSNSVIHPDSTYLITGGLGSIGLRMAQWLVAEGARSLVLIGRGKATEAVEEQLALLRSRDVVVNVAQVDVSQREQVASLLKDIEQSMPPLRGVLHAAGILDDGMLLNLNAGRFQKIFEAKVAGAWNLHTLTQDMPLDFFVLFSSAASLLGSPGQGNYGAANAFLDALAQHRHMLMLPALSINWGPWATVGLAAADAHRGARLALLGIGSLSPEQGEAALSALLRQPAAQVAVMPLNVRQWQQSYPQASQLPLLANLLEKAVSAHRSSTQVTAFRATLEKANPHEQRAMLETHVCEQIARVLRIRTSRLDGNTVLASLGLDSLMGLELRNRLESSLAVTLQATIVWRYPTVAQLTNHIAEIMDLVPETTVSHAEESTLFLQEEEENIAKALGMLRELSNDELAMFYNRPHKDTGEQ